MYTHTHICNWLLFSHKEQNHVVCKKINGTRDHYVKKNELDSDKYYFFLSCVEYRFEKNDTEVEGRLFGKRKGIEGKGDKRFGGG
jgi:hypothetical protein